MDVKPWDDETDMVKLEEVVRAVEMEGLHWGACKFFQSIFSTFLYFHCWWSTIEVRVSGIMNYFYLLTPLILVTAKLVTVVAGIKKLSIMMTIVDDLVSIDNLIEDHLTSEPNNEYIQSCDIVAFNKICKYPISRHES